MAPQPEKGHDRQDVEDQEASGPSAANANPGHANLDEYGKLVKYISTYREEGSAVGIGDAEIIEKRVWYAPWRKRRFRIRKIEGAGYPDEWLMTDIRDGLSSEDVETRRRRTGFNELAAEKQNLLAKFMSYFQGPILYGEQSLGHSHGALLTRVK